MTNNSHWKEIEQNEAMAYFRGDLALSMPESYSLDEKREILNEMIETSQAILDEMRDEFYAMTIEQRVALLHLLVHSGEKTPEFWWDALVAPGDPFYRKYHIN